MSLSLFIDIETLSLTPRAAIISIGLVPFDPHIQNSFEQLKNGGQSFNINLRKQIYTLNRQVSESTLEWHQRNTGFLPNEESFDKGIPPKNVASYIRDFSVNNHVDIGSCVVWFRGPQFDESILRDLFATTEQKVPWNYREVMDLRSWARAKGYGHKDLLQFDRPAGMVPHSAIDDAAADAYLVQRIQVISAFELSNCYKNLYFPY